MDTPHLQDKLNKKADVELYHKVEQLVTPIIKFADSIGAWEEIPLQIGGTVVQGTPTAICRALQEGLVRNLADKNREAATSAFLKKVEQIGADLDELRDRVP